MLNSQSYKDNFSVAAGTDQYIDFRNPLPANGVAVANTTYVKSMCQANMSQIGIVNNGANTPSAFITLDDDVDSGSLWSEVDFTNNGVSIDSDITGIKLVAAGGAVLYTIRGK